MANHPGTISHSAIIKRADGAARVAALLGLPRNRVKAWVRNDGIPEGYWNKVVDAGLASFRELADAAEAKVEARDAA